MTNRNYRCNRFAADSRCSERLLIPIRRCSDFVIALLRRVTGRGTCSATDQSIAMALGSGNNYLLLWAAVLAVIIPCNNYAQESVRCATDRSLYAAGETIWMRAWVNDDEGVPTSKFVYVELLRDGIGSVERRIKLKERGGMFFGQMDLPEDLESGWYTLRAYTRAQKDWPAEALYHSRVLIRGSGAVPLFFQTEGAEKNEANGIEVSVITGSDGHLLIQLTDAEGHPVAGNFALSVVPARYADFDYQCDAGMLSSAEYAEGEREYTQSVDFRIKCARNRFPDKYNVTIMSQDIGYYYSTEVSGDRSLKGDEGQLFRIPELDYPDGTLFTVNVTGYKFLYPEGEEEAFAAPFDYGPTYPNREVIRDTATIRRQLEGTITPLAADDTIAASRITAAQRPAYYKPARVVGPYSSVFEWRQIKLREELEKYDDMDLMTYIAANWTGLVCTVAEGGILATRSMYTTRSSSIRERITVSHGKVEQKTATSYNPVRLYIDGAWQEDWQLAATMSVRHVQNIYVLRGPEAALYKEAAVVLLELRHFDEQSLDEWKTDVREKNTVAIRPLGYQRPKNFQVVQRPLRQGTIYWSPCIRTDTAGHANLELSDCPAEGCYFHLVGQSLDGRFFSTSIAQ